MRPGEEEENAKHLDTMRQVQDLLNEHEVDLIVVCADSLEARKLKKSLLEAAREAANNCHNEINENAQADNRDDNDNQNQNSPPRKA